MNDKQFISELQTLLACGREMLRTLNQHNVDVPPELSSRFDDAILRLSKIEGQ